MTSSGGGAGAEPVQVYIYDLARGMASQFSGFVGFQLDGIWHTAVVCHGREWFFGGGGVESSVPGGTVLGDPLRTFDAGTTNLSADAFVDYLRGLANDRFRGDRYSLLDHNCNNFSDEVCRFLTGRGIPSYILELPEKVKRSPIAPVLAPLIEQATPRGQDIGQRQQEPTGPQYSHFPLLKYVTFAKAIDATKFREKAAELVAKHSERLPTAQGAEQIISSLVSLSTVAVTQPSLSASLWATSKHLLQNWPVQDVFPVLDCLRYATSQVALPSETHAADVVDALKRFLVAESSPTVLQLTLKVVCNLFNFETSRRVLLRETEREDLLARCNAITEDVEERPAILETALATVPLNYTVAWLTEEEKFREDADGRVQALSALVSAQLPAFTAPEAAYRALVALGALVTTGGTESRDLAQALDAPALMTATAAKLKDVEKVAQCAEECKKAIAADS